MSNERMQQMVFVTKFRLVWSLWEIDNFKTINRVSVELCFYAISTLISVEFFLNGEEFSSNSVNSANSGNLINHWSMNWAQFKDPMSHMCLAGTMVAFWSFTQEVIGSKPFNDNYFCHWIHWKSFRKNSNVLYNNLGISKFSSISFFDISPMIEYSTGESEYWSANKSKYIIIKIAWKHNSVDILFLVSMSNWIRPMLEKLNFCFNFLKWSSQWKNGIHQHCFLWLLSKTTQMDQCYLLFHTLWWFQHDADCVLFNSVFSLFVLNFRSDIWFSLYHLLQICCICIWKIIRSQNHRMLSPLTHVL